MIRDVLDLWDDKDPTEISAVCAAVRSLGFVGWRCGGVDGLGWVLMLSEA